MNVETIPLFGWQDNLRLSNDTVELVVTLDVGPRILVYKALGRDNVFKTFENQLGTKDEPEWRLRGGHRLWLAPESETLSYDVDNTSVAMRQNPQTGEVIIETTQKSPQPIRKSLGILLAEGGSRVSVHHTATNLGTEPITMATWGLSIMEPGGLEIIPQPPLGEHPRDLLPNRGIVLWPYTDLSDPRLTFGQKFWLLRQDENYPPFKMGTTHRERWIAYVVNDSLFIKTFDYLPDVPYPDGGCNFETFANSEMLEIESLSPLLTLQPGESVGHTETWFLFPLNEQIQIETEESLADWIAPYLDIALS